MGTLGRRWAFRSSKSTPMHHAQTFAVLFTQSYLQAYVKVVGETRRTWRCEVAALPTASPYTA